MAARAVRARFDRRKLAPVNVLMTLRAFQRRALEVDAFDPRFRIRRAMTLAARQTPVCAQQRKPCLRVIEAGNLQPGIRRMARRAPLR